MANVREGRPSPFRRKIVGIRGLALIVVLAAGERVEPEQEELFVIHVRLTNSRLDLLSPADSLEAAFTNDTVGFDDDFSRFRSYSPYCPHKLVDGLCL